MQNFKKIIFTIIGFILALILCIFILLKSFENKIYLLLLDRIDKSINIEISSQKTTLSLFTTFPNAALTFYNVNVNFNKKYSVLKNDTSDFRSFIKAGEITIKTNLFHLLRNPIIISGIEIKDAHIIAYQDQKGNKNFQLQSNFLRNDHSLVFEIQNISCKNVNFKYISEKSGLYLGTLIKNLSFKGKLQKNEINIKSKISLKMISFSSKDIHFVWNYTSNISCNLISNPKVIYLNNGQLNFINENIKFKGNIDINEPCKYDLILQSQSINVYNFKKFNMPFSKEMNFKNGNFSIYINIFQKNDLKSVPSFNGYTIIKNLSVDYKKYKLDSIKGKLFFKGKIYNTLNTSINGEVISGKLFNSHFYIPYFKYDNINNSLKANGSIVVNTIDFNKFFKDSIIKINSGELIFSFILKSRFDNKSNLIINKLFENSMLTTKDLNCTFLNYKFNITHLNCKINTSVKYLYITSLQATINNCCFSFIGNILHYQSLFGDSLIQPIISGELSGRYLFLDKIININNTINNKNSLKYNSDNFLVNLALKFDTISFKKLMLINYSSTLKYSNDSFSIKNINVKFCEGNVSNGLMNINIDPKFLILTSTCDFESINIEKLFNNFNDFGQNEITSKNIKGQIYGNIFCIIKWQNHILSKDDLQGYVNFYVNNGELNGFQPIYKLSKFIELSELNNIKFKRISNRISINNKLITIPNMNVSNSAINLSLSGTHSFENNYEYHFKVILSELLYKMKGSKNKKKNDFNNTEDDSIRNIYIKLQGDSVSFKFTYDSREAFKAFADNLKLEKFKFRKILNEEFNLFKKDSTLLPNSPKIEQKEIIESKDIKSNKKIIKTNRNKLQNKIEWKDD